MQTHGPAWPRHRGSREGDLGEAVAIAQVDEVDPAEVAPRRDPAVQDGLPSAAACSSAQRAAGHGAGSRGRAAEPAPLGPAISGGYFGARPRMSAGASTSRALAEDVDLGRSPGAQRWPDRRGARRAGDRGLRARGPAPRRALDVDLVGGSDPSVTTRTVLSRTSAKPPDTNIVLRPRCVRSWSSPTSMAATIGAWSLEPPDAAVERGRARMDGPPSCRGDDASGVIPRPGSGLPFGAGGWLLRGVVSPRCRSGGGDRGSMLATM